MRITWKRPERSEGGNHVTTGENTHQDQLKQSLLSQGLSQHDWGTAGRPMWAQQGEQECGEGDYKVREDRRPNHRATDSPWWEHWFLLAWVRWIATGKFGAMCHSFKFDIVFKKISVVAEWRVAWVSTKME